MNLLERLRHANNATKAQVSFLGALVATLVITGVWATTLPARFSSDKITPEATLSTEKAASPNMFGGFGEAIKNQFASVFDAFEVPPELEESPTLNTAPVNIPTVEETLSVIVDAPTSSSSPTTTPAVLPVPAMIQISTTPATTSSATTTSESTTSEPAVSEPERAPTPRVIMIATTTGSGTQTAP